MLKYLSSLINRYQNQRKNHKIKTANWLKGKGIEIGAFRTPIEGIRPYYIDKFMEFAGERCQVDVCCEPNSLPFRTNSLDFVAASHVVEHIANPVAAICEWYRVVRPGGMIYLVIPDRRYTWDRNRDLTLCDHLFLDYSKGITDSDATHIDDFVENVEWSEFSPSTAHEDIPGKKSALKKTYYDAVNAGQIINIHFHVFEPDNARELFRRIATDPLTRLKLVVEDFEERFPEENPNGFLIVLRSRK